MEFDPNYDLQAAHEREFKEEADARFAAKFPRDALCELEKANEELATIRYNTDSLPDIYARVDKLVDLTMDIEPQIRQLENTLSQIKYALYTIIVVLVWHWW